MESSDVSPQGVGEALFGDNSSWNTGASQRA